MRRLSPRARPDMCLVVPGQVTHVDGPIATVDVDGRARTITTLMDPNVRIGDWVVVAAGTILRRLDAADARRMREAVDVAYANSSNQRKAERSAS